MYTQRIIHVPAVGKSAELRAALEGGITGWPGLRGHLLFASMADMDRFRAANEQDSTHWAFLNKAASLSRAPVQQRIQRILANFPT